MVAQWRGLIAIALGPAVYVADPVGSGIVGMPPALLAVRSIWESLISSIFFVLIYHTFRQLRLVDQIHRKISGIDLFDQGPLYGFSRVTSQTAIGLIVLLVPGILLIPEGAGAGFIIASLACYGVTAVIPAAAFVVPLRGIHDLITAEKRRIQADLGRRITLALMAIQTAVDSEDGPAIEAQNRALSTLVAVPEVVNRVPTWPWTSGAITGFATALVLPIVLFLIQRYLGDFLAR